MTFFDSILIVLVGLGPPVILPVSIILCLLVYRRTKSIGLGVLIVVSTPILLSPSFVYLWARLRNGG